MSSVPPNLSIPDVLRLLEEKQKHLEQLLAQREQIQQQVHEIDREIQAAATIGHLPRRRSQPRPRLTNSAPLREFVLNALKKHKKGLLITEVTGKILEAGYQTNSELFQNVVYQYLYKMHEVELDRNTGRYTLRKE